MSIDRVVLGLSSIFPDVEFDVDIEKFGDGSEKYKVWVSNLNFYLENKHFKVVCRAMRNKYKKVKWFAYYCRIKN